MIYGFSVNFLLNVLGKGITLVRTVFILRTVTKYIFKYYDMKFYTTLVLLFSFFIGNAQIEIFGDAQAYLEAFVIQDFDTLSTMTYDNVVELAGGRDYFVADQKAEFKQSNTQGLTYVSANIMEFDIEDIYTVGEELHAVIPHDVIITVDDKKYRSISYLLGISTNEGDKWKFINLKKYNLASLKLYVPSLPDSFNIPETVPFAELRD